MAGHGSFSRPLTADGGSTRVIMLRLASSIPSYAILRFQCDEKGDVAVCNVCRPGHESLKSISRA